MGSSASPPSSGTATAFKVKSRARRSSSIAGARSAVTSACQASPAATAQGRVLGRSGKAKPEPARARARRVLLGARLDHQVDVAHLLAQQRVADGAADDPRRAPCESGARGGDRLGVGEASFDAAPAHAPAIRLTRALSPVVTS